MKKLCGVAALAAGAFMLGPAHAQSDPLDDWNKCMDTWGDESICGQMPTADPPPDTDTGSGTGSDTGSGTGSDTGSGTGSDTGSGTGSDTGSGTGSDTGSGTGSDTGSGTGSTPPVGGTPGGHANNGKGHGFGHWRAQWHHRYGHAKHCPKVTSFSRSAHAAVAKLIKKVKSR